MLVAIKSPEQLARQIEQRRLQASNQAQATPVSDALASHVKGCWEKAKTTKAPITKRLLDCIRRRKGEYSPEHLAKIKKTNGSDIFMMITAAKCRASKAWISDLYNQAGDKPWSLTASPSPDMPLSVQRDLYKIAYTQGEMMGLSGQDIQSLIDKQTGRIMAEVDKIAEMKAAAMEEEIHQTLLESNWQEELNSFFDDVVTFPYAIFKGIEYVSKKDIEWVDVDGRQQAKVVNVIKPKFRRVSPFSFYWSQGVTNDLNGHWCIEHRRFTRSDLDSMRQSPGYRAEAISQALMQYSVGGLHEWLWEEGERASIEGRNTLVSSDEIDCLEWTGSLQGKMLIDWGMNEQSIPDPLREYQVSVMTVGNYTIRAVINPDPMGLSPYSKVCWEDVPGSFCGNALPELIADCQDMCNATARSLANNLAISSGPQVWVEMDRMAAGANTSDIFPWKVWHSKSGQSSGPGVGFFQPQINSHELLSVYERFSKYADEISGLPSYAYGSDSGAGAAKTASGLSMLMNAASKSIKLVIRGVDQRVIQDSVTKVFNYLMLNSDKEYIKGDANAKARGSEALMHKEQAVLRQQELLTLTANPIDLEIIGKEGRSEMLREVMKSGSLPVDRVMGDREAMMERFNQQKMEQQDAAGQQIMQDMSQ